MKKKQENVARRTILKNDDERRIIMIDRLQSKDSCHNGEYTRNKVKYGKKKVTDDLVKKLLVAKFAYTHIQIYWLRFFSVSFVATAKQLNPLQIFPSGP